MHSKSTIDVIVSFVIDMRWEQIIRMTDLVVASCFDDIDINDHDDVDLSFDSIRYIIKEVCHHSIII
jgi:hypothetical protein